MHPETRYAKSGEIHVAYQVVGEGPLDLVYIPSGTHHVELNWENPPVARFLGRLATLSRVIVFDKRGTGMSDRVVGAPSLETRMDDIRAVMDASDSDRAVLFALGDAGPLCALFAATFPERTDGLMLMNSAPRLVRSVDLPWLPTRGEHERRLEEMSMRWSDPALWSERFSASNPDATAEEVQSFARVFRLSVSPGAFLEYLRMNLDVDVCDILPSIRVPTLILHRAELRILDVRVARYLAARIPGARLVELPGRNFGPPIGDQETLFAEIARFLTDAREARDWEDTEPDRVLSTILFTDIVGATARAAELGDRAWRVLLQEHHEAIRRQLARFRGKEIDTAGDGLLCELRRAGPRDRLCVHGRCRGSRAWHGHSRRAAHRRVRARRREGRRHRGTHRRPGRRAGSARGGARLEHGQGPRRGLGNRVRGAWNHGPQGPARGMGPVRSAPCSQCSPREPRNRGRGRSAERYWLNVNRRGTVFVQSDEHRLEWLNGRVAVCSVALYEELLEIAS